MFEPQARTGVVEVVARPLNDGDQMMLTPTATPVSASLKRLLLAKEGSFHLPISAKTTSWPFSLKTKPRIYLKKF
jgi:hypothetical protein